eukprot:m.260469 g.260469  ORF g.260469 m.260469 type:complete len:270 (+) comp39999_c0_seq1:67-876(+)
MAASMLPRVTVLHKLSSSLRTLPSSTLPQPLSPWRFAKSGIGKRCQPASNPRHYSSLATPADRKEQTISRRQDNDLETQSRLGKLKIELVDSTKLSDAEWLLYDGPKRTVTMAQHNKIFRDVFESASWVPSVNLVVEYGEGGHVHRGNILQVTQTAAAPRVHFDAEPNSSWTLALVSPDGHVGAESNIDVHWMVANINGGDVSSGDTVIGYKSPAPVKGTGFYRYVFCLFKQPAPVTPDDVKLKSPSQMLEDFTASGLSFFQAKSSDAN